MTNFFQNVNFGRICFRNSIFRTLIFRSFCIHFFRSYPDLSLFFMGVLSEFSLRMRALPSSRTRYSKTNAAFLRIVLELIIKIKSNIHLENMYFYLARPSSTMGSSCESWACLSTRKYVRNTTLMISVFWNQEPAHLSTLNFHCQCWSILGEVSACRWMRFVFPM